MTETTDPRNTDAIISEARRRGANENTLRFIDKYNDFIVQKIQAANIRTDSQFYNELKIILEDMQKEIFQVLKGTMAELDLIRSCWNYES